MLCREDAPSPFGIPALHMGLMVLLLQVSLAGLLYQGCFPSSCQSHSSRFWLRKVYQERGQSLI